ncbi:desiccation-related protein PCC13-62-like [Silene latifolia]|uniref:desiccation-related protein PCC13-62-like n=1 Tax=Silene latifolia TaxID=37657 RepID=UPI003D780759
MQYQTIVALFYIYLHLILKMAILTTSILKFTLVAILFSLVNVSNSFTISQNQTNQTIPQQDIDLIEFNLNLVYLEAEFLLHGALGYGLDKVAPDLAARGPTPKGSKKAFLDPFTHSIIYQLGLQKVGNIRAIKKVVPGFPRPLMNLTKDQFAAVMTQAFGRPIVPHFDPYANSINYLIATYLLFPLGLTSYVGTIPKLQSTEAQKLVGSLLAVQSGQDAVVRTLLYERRLQRVHPYGIPVQEFTNKLSIIRNTLSKEGTKDEGLFVNPKLGPEGKIPLNILSGDENSVGYAREPEGILRICYSHGNESKPGGFYPNGANGTIARCFLSS